MCVAGQTVAAEFTLDPRTSILRASEEVPPLPLAIELSGLGVSSGDEIYVATRGEFNFGTVLSDVSQQALAVFSASSTIDPDVGLLHRVPGAIDAGTDTTSPPTRFGGFDTDIAEDFGLNRDGVRVVVPEGAAFLLVQARDSYFTDNSDIDSDFRLVVLEGPGPCVRADLAVPFGVLDLSDVNAFVVGFVGNDLLSDLNDDGVWDLGDIGLFVDAFLGGCS